MSRGRFSLSQVHQRFPELSHKLADTECITSIQAIQKQNDGLILPELIDLLDHLLRRRLRYIHPSCQLAPESLKTSVPYQTLELKFEWPFACNTDRNQADKAIQQPALTILSFSMN